VTEPPSDTAQDLGGRVIAVPEARLLDVLASLLERRGAKVLRCPLVGIHDSSDQPSIVAWIRRRISGPSDDLLIFYTGEGVERLMAAASRAGLDGELVAAMRRTRKLIRGPKPRRALRRVDLEPELEAGEPTTAGLIATLKTIELPNRRIALQLYAPDQEMELVEYLRGRNIEPDCVAPYVYASAAEDERVVELISRRSRPAAWTRSRSRARPRSRASGSSRATASSKRSSSAGSRARASRRSGRWSGRSSRARESASTRCRKITIR
jgi:uroporphyrinogen-III synthase